MGRSHSKQKQAPRINDETVRDEVDMAVRQALQGKNEMDLVTKVQINVSVKELSKPGFYCVVGYDRVNQDAWNPIGFTETSSLTDAPSFVKSLTTDYTFESPQRIRLEVYKLATGARLEAETRGVSPVMPYNAELVSTIDCMLAEAVAAPSSCLHRKVDVNGKLTMFVEEIKILQSMIRFDLKIDEFDVKKLPKSKKDRKIYFRVYRSTHQGRHGKDEDSPQIIKTESRECPVGKDGFVRDINWPTLNVSVNSLCRGEPNRPIAFEMWEVGSKGDVLVGSCTTTYAQLEVAARDAAELPLQMFSCDARVVLHSILVQRIDSFLDYIAGGLEMSLFIALDFTKSNKDPTVPGSLHSFNDPDGNPNDYVRAIHSVVDILQHYDSDKKVPVYGFGARLPPLFSHCSHCFACNGDYFNPEVTGTDEIIRVYREAVSAVALHGPTNFHEIVRLVADVAAPYADPDVGKQNYSVLLILTDGVITDMKQTVNEVVRAADFPMSIVVVGIGEEDFGLMKMLDADDQKLYSTDERRFAARDIVQFVQFNKFKDGPMDKLAAETLAEIPREVVAFFKDKGILPGTGDSSSAVYSASMKGSVNEMGEPRSDLQKQLDIVKADFISAIGNSNVDIDEFEIYKIINEDKIPWNDMAYFLEVASKAPRGSNVFSRPRMVSIDGVGTDTSKGKRLVKDASSTKSGSSPKSFTSSFLSRNAGNSPVKSAVIPGPVTESPAICTLCFDRFIDTVLVPCGHACVCSNCGESVNGTCPVCRKPVDQVVKTYSV